MLPGDLAGEGRRLDGRGRRRDSSGFAGPRGRRDRGRPSDRTCFVGGEDERDRLSDRDHVAISRGHVAKKSGGRRLDLGGDLVGLDLYERLTLRHRVAWGLEPVQDLAALLRQLQRRHDDARGHQAFRQSAFAASKTMLEDGTVRSSSTGENGTGTSMAPMRLTGASR